MVQIAGFGGSCAVSLTGKSFSYWRSVGAKLGCRKKGENIKPVENFIWPGRILKSYLI